MSSESTPNPVGIDWSVPSNTPQVFPTMFEHHHLVMLLIDPDTDTIADANLAAARFYGYTREQLRGMPVRTINRLSRDELRGKLDLARRQGTVTYTLPHYLASGESVLVEIDIVLIEINRRALLFAIVKDVSQLYRALEELRHNEQRFRALAEASPDAITVTDLNGIITFVNSQTARIYGFESSAEMLGLDVMILIAPDERARAQTNTQRALAGEGSLDPQYRLLRRDGTPFLAELSVSAVFDTLGEPNAIIGVTHDITAREHAQAALRQLAQRLSLLNEIGQAITSTLELDPMLLTLLERTRQAIGAEACSVALLDSSTGELVYRQAVGIASRDVIGLRLRPGQGVAGWVAEHGESIVIIDPLNDARFFAAVDHHSGFVTRNLVCVPMVAHDTVIGVIQQINKHVGEFIDDDVRLLEAVAAQTSVVIDNVRLFTAERVERQRLEAIFRVGQTINSTLDPTVILDRLTDEAMRVTHATRGSAIIARPELGIFERLSLRGYSPDLIERAGTQVLELGRGINGRAYATRSIVRVDDVREDPDYFPLVPDTRSELVVPIVRGEHVLGHLDLQSPVVGAFCNIDLDFLRALADQVAIALENARLYQQSQEHASELERRVADRTAALQASEATARALLDAAPDAAYLLDIEGHILATNEIGARRLDHLSSQLIGVRIYDLLPPDFADARRQSVELVFSTGQPVRYEDERLGRYFENAIYPISDAANKVTRVAVYARDVTARRHAEEDMRRALDQERELSDLKSRFITIASHEFRTPMTTILSSAELLEHYSHRWPETKRLDYLQRIQTAVKHMVELVNDVLVVGRADAGRLEFNPAPIDLAAFCGNLVHEYSTGVGLQHQLHFRHSGQLGKVTADEKLWRHILGNLLSNAIKYSPPDSVIDVELTQAESTVDLVVRDSGIGIPAEDLPRLFDTFHRASNVGSIPGTGLGMSIVRQAVELHGGTIEVTSRTDEDHGTTFTVSLPLPTPI